MENVLTTQNFEQEEEQKTSKPKKRKKRISGGFTNFLLASGPLLGFLLFGLVPILISAYLSMTQMYAFELGTEKFIGFDNFIMIFTPISKGGILEEVLASFLSTLCCLIGMPIGIAIAIFIAQLMTKVKFMQRFFRSVFFIPYVCSTTVIVISFRLLFDNGGFGLINYLLSSCGLNMVEWLRHSPLTFFIAVNTMTIWQSLGSNIVLCMAAISNVNKTYYEAARVDGCSERYIFWHITIPAITPTLSYLVTMGLIGSLQTMEATYVLGEGIMGTPLWFNSANHMGYSPYIHFTSVGYIYTMFGKNASTYGAGLASAAGWVLAIFILLVTLVNLRLQKKWVCYDFA